MVEVTATVRVGGVNYWTASARPCVAVVGCVPDVGYVVFVVVKKSGEIVQRG